MTAGLGVVPGLENGVLVADTEFGLNEDEGVLERMLVRKTGRGLEVVTLVSRVLCFLMVSVSAAAKLSAVVCLATGDSLDHDGPPAASDDDDAELDTESELGDLVRAAAVGLGAGMGGLLAKGPVGRSITRSGVL